MHLYTVSIPPDEFIRIAAEQIGLMPQISEFVLNEGCAQLARWREAGITIGLAVNVSGREFADINLVDRVEACLRRYDIPAHLLTLEVTETEIMADLGAATKVLYELSARGIKLGIDDYGTGYSSLQYLHKLPVNELKIDRSFVTNLPNEASNRIIVRSSISDGALARALRDRRRGGGRAHLRHAGRGRVRLHSGLLPVQAPEGRGPPGVDPGRRQARVRTDQPRSRTRRARRSCSCRSPADEPRSLADPG